MAGVTCLRGQITLGEYSGLAVRLTQSLGGKGAIRALFTSRFACSVVAAPPRTGFSEKIKRADKQRRFTVHEPTTLEGRWTSGVVIKKPTAAPTTLYTISGIGSNTSNTIGVLIAGIGNIIGDMVGENRFGSKQNGFFRNLARGHFRCLAGKTRMGKQIGEEHFLDVGKCRSGKFAQTFPTFAGAHNVYSVAILASHANGDGCGCRLIEVTKHEGIRNGFRTARHTQIQKFLPLSSVGAISVRYPGVTVDGHGTMDN